MYCVLLVLQQLKVLPKDLSYELRFPGETRAYGGAIGNEFTWQTNLKYPLFQNLGPREGYANDGGKVGYNREGFLPIQNAIANTYIRMQTKEQLPPVFMQVRKL